MIIPRSFVQQEDIPIRNYKRKAAYMVKEAEHDANCSYRRIHMDIRNVFSIYNNKL
jgi:hypothetical protein